MTSQQTDPRPEATATDVPEELRVHDPEELIESGVRWLADYLETSGQARLIAGLSGGLDSTTTVLWAARAVGAERLTVLSLPCHTRGEDSDLGREPVRRARRVAEMVPGADFRVLDIGPAVATEAWSSGHADALSAGRWKGSDGTVFANLQARIRAVRLRTFANDQNGLVLGTGNLSEHLLGYFTVGGDEQADVGLLGELFKTEVRQIAAALEVPDAILGLEPSADLLPDQTDQRELGFTYAEADRVLVRLLDLTDGRSVAAVPASVRERLESEGIDGVRPNVIRRVLDRVDRTAFKRGPTPFLEMERSTVAGRG